MTSTKVHEGPILFSGPMVRAILDGRKTKTRRIVSSGNSYFGSVSKSFWDHADFDSDGCFVDDSIRQMKGFSCDYLKVPAHKPCCEECRVNYDGTVHRLYCRWEPGMRLWVREKWRLGGSFHDEKLSAYHNPKEVFFDHVHYAADDWDSELKGQYRPSIHMPRWASRITLEVTGVRVERLQEITEEDAIAEGFSPTDESPEWCPECGGQGVVAGWSGSVSGNSIQQTENDCVTCSTAIGRFRALWYKINGAGSWESNPWVWIVEFKRI